ncbi:DUF447 domain-containing protein [Halococcus saccharolyticus]|uniref:DUF447 family protein n=1 Tax=Halococcus saccharolyticus DSM 5350 TaxID=1227455 RepID=M0MKC2_9EURY|nr:DUF447 domain-containing protein [Halococcus saccharolyticus]EMA46132.1 hypothetical protein C449_05487 [Halococcus saccharolyticus DSM 5350]
MTEPSGTATDAEWPVALRGVTESVVATLGPNGQWNFAALGLHAGDPVTARTWGATRTRRNFHEEGEGVVQFLTDPVVFAESALSILERSSPTHPAADAWVRVAVEQVDAGESGGTSWAEWELTPVDSGVETERVPTTNRGYGAVIEATVAASRLDVDAYDTDELRARLDYFSEVVETCGDEREREAMRMVRDLTAWDRRRNDTDE